MNTQTHPQSKDPGYDKIYSLLAANQRSIQAILVRLQQQQTASKQSARALR